MGFSSDATLKAREKTEIEGPRDAADPQNDHFYVFKGVYPSKMAKIDDFSWFLGFSGQNSQILPKNDKNGHFCHFWPFLTFLAGPCPRDADPRGLRPPGTEEGGLKTQ